MRKFLVVFSIVLLTQANVVFAEYLESTVKVDQISVWSNNGSVLLKTEPRPNISTLSCTNDYWLVLDKSEPGYQQLLALLLTAQSTQKDVVIRAEALRGDQFCSLTRVITLR